MSTPRRRRVHFGIDYGTSNSKIVVRDFEAVGGERAHVVLRKGSERLSSSLALIGDEILFGSRRTDPKELSGATWYESQKMRAAGEIKGAEGTYYHGALVPLPQGLRARDLACMTLWWLITEASRAAESLVPRRAGDVMVPGTTVGIPMSFYRDDTLRRAFVEMARVAWALFRHGPTLQDDRLDLKRARQCLDEGYEAVRADPIAEDEVRFWVRSEAEAALWWAFRSPQVPDGPYAKIDIGAGTTNASVFRIVAEHQPGEGAGGLTKLKMAFFGADSTPTGMDAVDEALASWRGLDVSRSAELRGREDRLFENREAQRICAPVFGRMHGALCDAWRQNGRLNRRSTFERRAWIENAKVFLLGGGSLIDEARGRMTPMPFNAQRRLPVVNLESPPDLRLDGSRVPREALPFVLVGYGLSVLAPPVPLVETPDEIPPMQPGGPTLRQLDHQDIYSK